MMMNAARAAVSLRLPARVIASRATIFMALIFAVNASVAAQQNEQKQADPAQPPKLETPVEHADELKSKVTLAVYGLSNDINVDINLRHQFGPVVAWVAGFYDPKGDSLARIGGEYDFQYKWLLLVPTLEIGTNGALAGSLYGEMGAKTYAIAGYSQTNGKPFNDLFFDPSESVQLGLGRKVNNYDKLYGYVIFDVRLHTHQQDTHVLWRHRLNAKNGITLDFLYKSGRADDGLYIRNAGLGLYYDRPRWFWKAYYDPNVNFSHQDMVRLGAGLKF